MNAKACIVAVVLLVVSSSLAAGAVISRDWKTPGDGLLTYDTVSGREWLDFSPQLTLPAPRYDAVVGELGPGGMFEGFQVASRDDVLGLATSAGIDITMWSSMNHVPAGALVDLLSVSFQDQYGKQASGVVHDLDRDRVLVIGYRNTDRRFSGIVEYHSVSEEHGVWLYRQVPEPLTVILTIGGIGFLIAIRSYRTV